MGYANIKLSADLQLDTLSMKALLELYYGTIEELRRCASIEPDLYIGIEEVDLREAALLELEANVLNQAAKVQIRTKDDILNLMDIWANVTNVQGECDATPSDRIAMNIFRHMTGSEFVKD